MDSSFQKLNAFDRAFFTAAFWTAGDPPVGFMQVSRDNDEPNALWKLLDRVNKKTLLYNLHNWRVTHEDLLAQSGTEGQNGRDLWLTQGNYGSGFWDRGYSEELDDQLCEAAHEFGPLDCYIDDDRVSIE